MIEQIEEYIQKLLAVPFSPIFGLSERLLNQLKKDFYKKCFVHASDNIKENMHIASEPVKTAFEIDLSTKEMLDRADKIRDDEKSFMTWLHTQQNNVYYVRGDAGTGKSVYLHWLKYHAEQEEPEKGWKWEIIDIAKADESVKILDITVQIPHFELIFYKVISAIMRAIEKRIYLEKSFGKGIDHEKTAIRFKEIYTTYMKVFDVYYPDRKVREFFCSLPLKTEDGKEKTSKQISEDCGRYIAKKFKGILDEKNKIEALELCLQIFLYLIRCLDSHTKFVLAIDNVERIIGNDEVYNIEITKFASSLRTIQNTIVGNNECLRSFYKLVVFMRNTSVRMLTPQQITDIRPSTHDMSDWFDVEAIIYKKITWYEKQGEKLESSDELLSILQDNFNDDGNLRGLYTKISMIFNNNKRVIVHFLINVLGKESNRKYIEFYNQLREHNVRGLSNSLSQFAARSIIYRLLLNEMRQDNFFNAIMTESDIQLNKHSGNNYFQKVKSHGTAGLGYARRILTIAYEYKLNHPNEPYKSLKDIIGELFCVSESDFSSFYNLENAKIREQISDILFAMNYYDGRNGDWLQLIDIHYYPEEKGENTRIPSSNKMKEILEKDVEKIRVKITTAGTAYLYFISFSYEYFACKSINSKTRKEIMGEYDIPPLLCTIPKKKEIVESKIEDLTCIKTIRIVLVEALRCITKMNKDEQEGIAITPFRKELERQIVKHTERIVNSHRGYLDNYVECLCSIYSKDAEKDRAFGRHFNLLIETIREMRDFYRYDASEEIDNYKARLQELLEIKQRYKNSFARINKGEG